MPTLFASKIFLHVAPKNKHEYMYDIIILSYMDTDMREPVRFDDVNHVVKRNPARTQDAKVATL